MATSKNRLEFELRLKDLATQALRNMGATVKKETQKADTAFRKMAGGGMAKALKGFGKLAAATFGVMSVVSALRLFSMAVRRGVQDAVKFSLAMAEVSTISQEATDNLPMLSQQVLNLSTQFGLQETDAAKALYQTISSGFTDVTQAMGILDSAVVLSVGGLADLRETVDLLTNTLNAYGMEAEESAKLTDIFFETVRLGKTTIPEMTNQLGLVTPIAANLGISIQELTAMLAALTKGGINTQIATTYMRAALVQVLNVSSDARELLAEKGLAGAFSAANLKANGFLDTLKKVKAAIGDNVEQMRILFPNIRALVPILALTGNQMDDFGKIMEEISTIASRKVTPAMDALDRVMMSSGKKWQVVTNAMRQGFMELGMGIIETVVGPIGSVEDLGNMAIQVRQAIAGLKPVVTMMIALMMTLGGVFIKVFGALVEVASRFSKELGLSEGAIGRLRASAAGLELTGELLLGGAQQAMFGDAAGAIENLSNKLREQKLALIDDGLALQDLNNLLKENKIKTDEDRAAWAERLATTPGKDLLAGEIAALEMMGYTISATAEQSARDWDVFWQQLQGFPGGKTPEGSLADNIVAQLKDVPRELAIQQSQIAAQLGRALQSRPIEEAMRMSGEALANSMIQGFTGGAIGDVAGVAEFGIATGADPQELATDIALFMQAYQSILTPAMRKAMAPAFIEAWDLFRELGGEAFVEVFDPVGADTTEGLDRLTAEWKKMFKDTFEDVDPAVFEGLNSGFTSMDEAMEMLGLNMRMFEYSAAGANAKLLEMKHAQDIAKLSLQGLDRKTIEYADTKKFLAQATFSESVYALYAEIAAEKEAGKTVAELSKRYEYLAEILIAYADAMERVNNANTKAQQPFQELMARSAELGQRFEEIKTQAVDAFAEGVAGAMMDAVTGAEKFDDAMKKVFANLLMMIGQAIVKMYILAAIEAAGFGAAKGAVFSGGLSEPVPLATGGVIPGGLGRALPLRAYATGGIVSGPHIAVMGEGGRDEAILPLERMAGGDLGVKSSGGGATNVNITINAVDAKGVDELLVSRQDTLRNIIRQAMTESRAFRSTMLGQTGV